MPCLASSGLSGGAGPAHAATTLHRGDQKHVLHALVVVLALKYFTEVTKKHFLHALVVVLAVKHSCLSCFDTTLG